MAKIDFCFTFYDGDATRDASHMNRLERGAYYDLIIAQRKFGRLSLDQIRKVLGKDFDDVWPAIELTMLINDGFYYIEWLENSLQRMVAESRNQSGNGSKGGRPRKKKPDDKPNESQLKADQNPTESQKKPLEDGYGYEDEFKNKNGAEPDFVPSGIVPEMAKQFTDENPKYYFDRETDFACIREIAGKIVEWLKLPGYESDIKNAEPVKRRWGELITHIKADSHLRKYSLAQINKHFSSITQSFCSEPVKGSSAGKSSKPGTGTSRIEKLRALRGEVLGDASGSKSG